MKQGVLTQYLIQDANTPECAYIFGGASAYILSFTNPHSTSTEFSVAHVPAGEALSTKHWLILKEDVQNWNSLPVKYLASSGDQLYVAASAAEVTLHVHGVDG